MGNGATRPSGATVVPNGLGAGEMEDDRDGHGKVCGGGGSGGGGGRSRRGSAIMWDPKMILPERILLVRHGESLGNVDENAYSIIPDWKIPLTERGKAQATELGAKIKAIVGEDAPISVYFSPYMRTKQTLSLLMAELRGNPLLSIREEPRLTEQQFGNFQTEEMLGFKTNRQKYGKFYYRFPDGESGLDVYSRVSSFIGTLFREWAKAQMSPFHRNSTIIIVTHGITLRLFLMRWFQYSVEEFEESRNPSNCELVVMQRVRYETLRCATHVTETNDILRETANEYLLLDEGSRVSMNFPVKAQPLRTVEERIQSDLDHLSREANKGYAIMDEYHAAFPKA